MKKENDNKFLPSEEQTERFDRLHGLLNHIVSDMTELSKRKPEGALNKLKVKMINKVLIQVKEFFSSDPVIEFLELLDDETLPTNSDAVLIIGQFRAVITQFRKKFYRWDSEMQEDRWFTKENPPEDE